MGPVPLLKVKEMAQSQGRSCSSNWVKRTGYSTCMKQVTSQFLWFYTYQGLCVVYLHCGIQILKCIYSYMYSYDTEKSQYFHFIDRN